MRSFLRSTGPLVLGVVVLVGLFVYPAFSGDKTKPASWSGTVSDSNCGAKHVSDVNPAECTRACIQKGASYALVSGETVYILKGGDATALDKLAGQKATVSGTLDGNTIEVAAVQPLK
ncbi:MAG TPA: hypothetical protein VE825_03170 [Terriglobales bacterium]|jgi:hypothetical protein|nr:hypothetical protein [Terriglobales bacterium]